MAVRSVLGSIPSALTKKINSLVKTSKIAREPCVGKSIAVSDLLLAQAEIHQLKLLR
jgi:hypothetical protein